MPKFKVCFNVLADYEYIVEAKNADDACELANERWLDGSEWDDFVVHARELSHVEEVK